MNNSFNSLTNPIIVKAYEGMDNYIIEKVSDSKVAVIYCSSNGIYYPNEYDIFKRYMYDGNKFEWIKRDWKIINSGLNIYIRDVYKQWYLKGINKKVNNIDKLVEFIKEQTIGYEIVTIGSSSGAYIATLLGCKLNAKYVLNFAGQFDLSLQHNKNLFVHNYIENDNIYTNLKSLVESSNTDIFYFVGAYSEVDEKDLEIAKSINKNLYLMLFNQKIHGIPFDTSVLEKLINMNEMYFLNYIIDINII